MGEAVDIEARASIEVLGPLAAGGMASLFLARRVSHAGVSRLVVVKRLHASMRHDPQCVAMLLDEARLGACIEHPLVREVIDVVIEDGVPSLVCAYVPGVSLAELGARLAAPPPLAVVAAVAEDMLSALHATHEARDASGSLLGVVHRDVSPQNLVVAVDGSTRLIDFGVAKASWNRQTTLHGETKGKPAYMAPEQAAGQSVDRRADLFGAALVVLELAAGKVLSDPDARAEALAALDSDALAAVLRRALSPAARERFDSAAVMADALTRAVRPAPRVEVASWLASVVGEALAEREAMTHAAPPRAGVRPIDDGAPMPTTRSARSWSGDRKGALGAMWPIAVAFLAGGVLVGRCSTSERTRAAAAENVTAAPPVTAAVDTGATHVTEAPATASTAPAPTPEKSAAPSATAPMPQAPHPNTNPSTRVAARPPPRAADAGAPNCSPPWTTSPDGVRTYKPECL